MIYNYLVVLVTYSVGKLSLILIIRPTFSKTCLDSPVVSCPSNYLLAQRLVSSQSVPTPPLVNSGSNILESTEFHDGLHANVVLANMSHFRDEKFMCDIEIEVGAAASLLNAILHNAFSYVAYLCQQSKY